jgi:DNA-binding LacI/PurR family transcriptional regulator
VCAAEAVGLTLVPTTGADSDTDRVAAAAVDGFVVWTTTDDDPVLDAVAATGLPAVIHAGPQRPGVPVVGIDDRAAAAAIGEIAFTRARRPVVLSFPLDRRRDRLLADGLPDAVVPYPVTRNRLEGFADAWASAGGDPGALRVAVCPVNSAGDGEDFTRELLASAAPPDAIAAMSDELALGAMRAAAAAGAAIPDALAVTGWDDSDAAKPAGLTTVAQSLRDQGTRCARLALGHRDTVANDAADDWRVVVRESTRR